MEQIISLLTALIADSLSGQATAHMNPILPESINELLILAKKHGISPIICSELIAQDMIFSQSERVKIQDALCESVCYYEKMNYEVQWLSALLEEAQIPFIPLKGAVVRGLYPQPWMRTSGDIDILIPESFLDQAVSLLLENGCRTDGNRRYHDIPLVTPGGLPLELHYHIREDIEAMDAVLDQVWQFCEVVPGKHFEYRQTDTFLIFHLLAHMAYHLINGGCGIRSVIDIWLMQRKNIDTELLSSLCSKAKLDLFYGNISHLIAVWFGGGQHSPTTKTLEQLIVTGGAFGTAENRILIRQSQLGNKRKYLLNRIFKPYKELKTQFPILDQKPWLTPAYHIIRWGRVITGRRINIAAKELKDGQKHSDGQIADTQKLLACIGLIV